MRPTGTSLRVAVSLVLLLAVVVTALVLLRAGSYTIHARFLSAGQLVKGGSVKVAGRKVGTISAITLTDSGQADVRLSIGDGATMPLHRGTRASIRALGQAGVANRFVALSPGSERAPQLDDGAVLGTEQTTSIVDLDAVLDSFGPQERANLQDLVANSERIFAGSGSRYFNRMLTKLDPALSQLGGLTEELARDKADFARVIDTAGRASAAIATRRGDLTSAVDNTARSLDAISGERRPLADLLDRAPRVLRQARGTLAGAGTALEAVRPALRDVPPVAEPLGDFLGKTEATLPSALPVVADLRDRLPALRASLAGLEPLRAPAVRALTSAGRALRDARHIVRGARIYGSDLLLGVFNGLAGVATANYDRWGHYARLEFTQPPQTTLGGPLSGLFSKRPLIPGLFDLRTRLLRRCPGGNTPPAIDGSSPWVPDSSLCTPSQDVPALVNQP